MAAFGLFIVSNLALGLTFSTIAGNQMQAIQLMQFTLLPSILLSVHAPVPRYAGVGAMHRGDLPDDHAMRITRGVLLKGNGVSEILPDAWPIALFTMVTVGVAV